MHIYTYIHTYIHTYIYTYTFIHTYIYVLILQQTMLHYTDSLTAKSKRSSSTDRFCGLLLVCRNIFFPLIYARIYCPLRPLVLCYWYAKRTNFFFSFSYLCEEQALVFNRQILWAATGIKKNFFFFFFCCTNSTHTIPLTNSHTGAAHGRYSR